MLSKSKWQIIFLIIIILILDLIFLFYVKYNNQNLPLSQFKFNYIGNIFNALFTLLLITGIIFYSLRRKGYLNLRAFINFTILITAFLFTAFLSSKINLPFSKTYLFDHSLNKFIVAGLFLVFQIIQIVFLSFVWVSISEKKIFVKSRTIINSFILFLGLMIFAFIFSNRDKKDFKLIEKPGKKYTAVVLGAAVWSNNKLSPSLESRVNKAIELYDKGIVNKIQLTGSNAPGEISEAKAAYNYISKKNINIVDVWIEENTTSTTEQISFIKNKLINQEKIKNIIIVSDAFHLARVREICEFYNIKTEVAASDLTLSVKDKIYNNLRESIALTIFWLFGL